jgi:menaquinone-specific isochorismate synthase
MQWLGTETFGAADQEGLRRFLDHCKERARLGGRPVLASITLPCEYVDPLAVLQMVNDLRQEHACMLHPSGGVSLAGAEPVLRFETSGSSRFRDLLRAVNPWLEQAVAVGDASLPAAGPQVFLQADFEDAASPAGIASLRAFIPRWQVACAGVVCSATANLLVRPEAEVSELIEPLWRAHLRLRAFEFPAVGQGTDADGAMDRGEDRFACGAVSPDVSYLREVRRAVEAIRVGVLSKVVLARTQELRLSRRCDPLAVLNRLRQRFPDCHGFSFQSAGGGSWIGASPERLVQVTGGVFQTEALAGSGARGQTATSDAFLSRQLLGSAKDRRENLLVRDYLMERLAGLGIDSIEVGAASLLQLSNIQHLRVPLRGVLPEGLHLLDLAQVLHPTPALAGVPEPEAQRWIAEVEGRRGVYGGVSGYFDGRGDGLLIVNIRCAGVSEDRVRLVAGAGIVADSDPEAEFRETEWKLMAMRPFFQEFGSAGGMHD